MAELTPIGKDATGYEVLTAAVKDMLNQYPGLYDDEPVKFEELGEESGLAFSADSGALVYSEEEDILGVIHQTCQYPFFILLRRKSTKEQQKIKNQNFLDTFGKWLCRETVEINGENQRLDTFPVLTGGRKINRITRDNSYSLEPQESGVQDWVLPVSVEYTNEFEL